MKPVLVNRLMEVVPLERPPPISKVVGLSDPPPLNIDGGGHLSLGWVSSQALTELVLWCARLR